MIGTQRNAPARAGPHRTNGSTEREVKAIAFVDCCGYTAYTIEHGDQAAVEIHMGMREAFGREAAAAEVDVVKWMGDGVMLAADGSPAILRCVYRTMVAARESGALPLRVGVAEGPVVRIPPDGLDYLGITVNRAAELCAAAAPWQVRVQAGTAHETARFTLLPLGRSVSPLAKAAEVIARPGAREPAVCRSL